MSSPSKKTESLLVMVTQSVTPTLEPVTALVRSLHDASSPALSNSSRTRAPRNSAADRSRTIGHSALVTSICGALNHPAGCAPPRWKRGTMRTKVATGATGDDLGVRSDTGYVFFPAHAEDGVARA